MFQELVYKVYSKYGHHTQGQSKNKIQRTCQLRGLLGSGGHLGDVPGSLGDAPLGDGAVIGQIPYSTSTITLGQTISALLEHQMCINT